MFATLRMDGIVPLILHILGTIPIVTPNCPAIETCLSELNNEIWKPRGEETICGFFLVYRNCMDAAEISCNLDLTHVEDKLYDQFPMCRTKRSGTCPQKKNCDDQFEQTSTSDRCHDSRTYETCLFEVMQSCDLSQSDLEPAIKAIVDHCGQLSILAAVDGVNNLGVFIKTLLNGESGLLACADADQCISQSKAVTLASQRKTFAELCSSLWTTQNCLDKAVSRCTSRDPFSEALLDVARSEIDTLCKTHTGCARLSQCSSLMLADSVNKESITARCSLVQHVLACLSNIRTICPLIPQVALFRLQTTVSQCDAGLYTNVGVISTTPNLPTTTTEYLGENVDMVLVHMFRKLMGLIQISSVDTRCVNLTTCVPSDYDYIDDLLQGNYDRFCDTMREMHFCLHVSASICKISDELYQAMTHSRKYLFQTCRPLGLAVAASPGTSIRNTGLWFAVAILARTTTYLQ
ncbi:uncharacterized protein LOC121381115 [Gigantopelta aegis]|uniref:uncharacterized protein LOC121381115 n=1 Tax=Gigantopelta aegis TaxID=1735272 RepID=UPI001B8891A7|nr:uncharacterized protein LOC121381115 [Gigantopelta aegis]